ncbi:hypothetical protein [Neobacillus niacini]|uniref:hypothetical protein n=1 Tax=Neobacillus niacini TaxID=86668 RepID=UPI00126A291B|nr:hypothetical protein [Neobacillus niacini]
MIKQLKFKMLLFLGLGIGGIFLTNYLTDLQKEIIILQNEEIFSEKIEPIDYYANEIDGNVDAGYIYSEEDQPIIDKREQLLAAADNSKTIGIIVCFIFIFLSFYYYDRFSKEKKSSKSL